LPRSTIFHSDRGSQYSSICFQEVLGREDFRQSMSGRANPYDNATTESFIDTLKSELSIGKAPFKNLAEAERNSLPHPGDCMRRRATGAPANSRQVGQQHGKGQQSKKPLHLNPPHDC